ncbi:alpha/beta hydrolase [Streptomyces sp. NPDC057253]|uniref:alpha/beta hydrolase n=1 Tax=Streptomyces sp. NPDC057253 TaxID=3346069 RepID=UPI00362F05A6
MTSRTDIEIPCGDTFLAAWLYRPAGEGRHPLVVMAHGIGAVREMRLDAFAERFQAAGLGVLVFDYRHLGASGGQPRQLVNIERQLDDWATATASARSVDWVDPDRVALWGTSFAGGHVLVAAARDPRVAAVVAQCPFIDGRTVVRATPLKAAVGINALAVADLATSVLRRGPVLVRGAGEPGSVALMTTPEALPALRRMAPDGYLNGVAARLAFSTGRYRPGREAAKVDCPVLFAICEKDQVTPPEDARRAAATARRAEVRTYPVDHFGIYFGNAFESAVADQCAFLTGHLLPAPL